MERCATCQWWGKGFVFPSEDRRYLDGEDRQGHHVCAKTITHGYVDDFERTDTSTMLAHSEDYDGFPRGLWTAPEFGCVQWEAKSE